MALAPAAAQCCFPSRPCAPRGGGRGELTCRAAASLVDCAEIAGDLFVTGGGFRGGLWQCEAPVGRGGRLPSWSDALWPFLVVPTLALAGMAVLWLALGRIYRCFVGGRLHRFAVTYIGCSMHPQPRIPDFMFWVNALQIAFSMAEVAIFVSDTYVRAPQAVLLRLVEALGGAYCAFHALVRGVQNEFKLPRMFGVWAIVDVLTVPHMLRSALAPSPDGWLSPKFLQSVVVLQAWQQLQALGAASRSGDQEIRRLGLNFGLKSFCFIVCAASLILLLEVLGDPVDLRDGRIETNMGYIDLFLLIYWLIETVCTVGFGDYSPKTLPSKAVMIVCMLSGVTVFTLQLGNLLSIMAQERQGAGSFRKSYGKAHVVLLGGGVHQIDETFLLAFLEELFHESYRNTWPELVVLTLGAERVIKVKDLLNAALDRETRHCVKCLDGSPLSPQDLARCRCDSANLVFVMANTTGVPDPVREDNENILRAVNVSMLYPRARVMVMLLAQTSKSRARSVGLRPQHCFSVVEMKNGILWQSTHTKGLSTLLANLMVTTGEAAIEAPVLRKYPWLQAYADGQGHEVYGLLPEAEFWGRPVREFVEQAYLRKGVCIFAAQVGGLVVLRPLTSLEVVGRGVVFFALAQDELMLHGIASLTADWTEAFSRSQMAVSKREGAAATREQLSWRTQQGHPTPRRGGTQTWEEAGAVALEGAGPGEGRASEHRPDAPVLQRQRRFPRRLGDQSLIRMQADRAHRIQERAYSRKFCLVLAGAGSWSHLVAFVSERSAPFLPFRMPAIVLCPEMPPAEVLDVLELQTDDELAVLIGSISDRGNLLTAGIAKSSIVVCLGHGQHTAASESSAALLDSDVVTLYRIVSQLAPPTCDMVFEFRRARSFRLLPREKGPAEEVPRTPTLATPQRQAGFRRGLDWLPGEPEPAHLDPRFASGRAFAPQVLGALFARSFHTPGILEVMEALVTHRAEATRAGELAELIWLVKLWPECAGQTYGDLFCARLFDAMHPAILLGIYRSCHGSTSLGNGGFVWTNPPKETRLERSDMVYVLANEDFGRLAHTSNLLPHSPAGITSLLLNKVAGFQDRRSQIDTDGVSDCSRSPRL